MKFTALEEYGLRCILHLARAAREETEDGPASTRATQTARGGSPGRLPLATRTVARIAAVEGVSVQYVGKLFRILAKAGLVESARGCKGGYRLSRPPAETSVAEVLDALGGRIFEPKTCERYSGDHSFCVHTNDCSIRSLWAGLQLMIDGVLSRTSLDDLICNEHTMAQWMRRSAERMVHWVESFAGDPARVQLVAPSTGEREHEGAVASVNIIESVESIKSTEPSQE